MPQIAFLLALLTSVAMNAEPFHFAVIGDRTGRAAPGVYEQAWREAEASKPDFIVTVGDAIEGLNDATGQAEWNSVKRSWTSRVPVYHTPGNHDIWDSFSEHLFVDETGSKPFYSFDFRGSHFVVLDNSRTEDLAPEQLDFLRADLSRRRGKSPTFVFFHRPFWLIPMKLGASGFVLQEIAKQYGVCCFVSGHGHQFVSVQRDGVLYLEVGSSGASLVRAGAAGVGFEDGWFYQYGWVTVDENAVTVEIRELSPPFGQARKKVLKQALSR